MSLIGFGGLSAFAALAGTPAKQAAVDINCSTSRDSKGNAIQIGQTWSGVQTQIGAAMSSQGIIYALYYDPDRYITLTSYNGQTNQICRRRLAFRFNGWDAHNSLTLAISNDGVIHATGNMHASPLIYARGTSLATIKPATMTGTNEQHVTYPQFLLDSAGNLLFRYRDGRSGNGIWRMNRWTNGRWSALPPLFVDQDGGRPTSAYPTAFTIDADGLFHVAIVWRRTADVASNYAVTYAKTRDFQTWLVNGHSIKGPLTPDNMEIIDTPGEGAGLVNNAALEISSTGQPLILFTKYAADGANAIYLATRTASGWKYRSLAEARKRTELTGGGSIPDMPRGSFGKDKTGSMEARISFGSGDTHAVALDLRPFEAITATGGKAAISTIPIPAGMADSQQASAIIRKNGVASPVYGQLRWFGQKPNRDHPYQCNATAPKACNPPPSPLLLYLN
ncbi:BNR repeat-containing protein [Sphingobium yanoikuyae]|uniref:BNR repeat-containing protein n=1 Tax=Sphingobium yanoikuyae TaxID=13690 RepID=UPI000563A933|nr:BNR repeat-containing protein [Sphingobium yanoikuyae]